MQTKSFVAIAFAIAITTLAVNTTCTKDCGSAGREEISRKQRHLQCRRTGLVVRYEFE